MNDQWSYHIETNLQLIYSTDQLNDFCNMETLVGNTLS